MENKMNRTELHDSALEKVAGGNDGLTTRKVAGLKTGFLALRSDAEYDAKNELGTLYNGDYVYSTERYCGVYVYVYAECKKDTTYDRPAYSGYGWVNSNFLTAV